jgi:hypothetical protein
VLVYGQKPVGGTEVVGMGEGENYMAKKSTGYEGVSEYENYRI